jgi:selenide,water dikinase
VEDFVDLGLDMLKAFVAPSLLPTHTDGVKRLTSFAHGGGCGCKVEPAQLKKLLEGVPRRSAHPDLLVGVEHSDDAAVLRLNDQQAIVFTNDFQTPLVDDPYIFGLAAAANALSDVYAMGGVPLMATAIAGFPINDVHHERLADIMRGGVDACKAVGIPLAGGHTIDNPQPIFGLAVVGEVHPNKIKTNAAARVGDRIILTKAIGIGVLASALRAEVLTGEGYCVLVEAITQINTPGAWLGKLEDVHALTDITGFGLAGHLVEMAEGAAVTMRVNSAVIPTLLGVIDFTREGVIPGGAYRNMEAYRHQLAFNSWDIDLQLLLTDPETNGGLLVTVSAEAVEPILERLYAEGFSDSCVIGEVVAATDHAVEFS